MLWPLEPTNYPHNTTVNKLMQEIYRGKKTGGELTSRMQQSCERGHGTATAYTDNSPNRRRAKTAKQFMNKKK